MLVNNKPSYTLQTGGTYSPDAPIDINPESIGNSESSYRFVEPIGGGGSAITDYVSKTNGGIFDNLLSYPSALGIVSDFNLVYKSWVVDEIDAKIVALGAGTVSSIVAGDGMDFSEIITTGDIILGTPSTLTLVTTNALTATSHTHELSGVQAYLDGTGFVKSTAGTITYDTNTYLATSAFNGLFDARFITNFAASSLSNLSTRNHANLNAIAGSSDGYHLSAGNYAIASRAATTTQSGYLTDTDYNYFYNKLDSLTEGVGIDITGGVISTIPADIDHNSLLNYDISNHRIINDTGVADTDLWSANKIISYLTDANITFTDVTTNNASVTKHGFLPKLANDTGKYLRSDGAWITIPVTGDFLDSVIRMVVDNGFDPGAVPTDGDRYIIMNSGSIHANFGTIDKKLDGSVLTLGSNDLVQYVTNAGEFRIAYDSSTATSPATVAVGVDKNGDSGYDWSYNITDDVWVIRGNSAGNLHNSLVDLNSGIGDYYHVSSTEQIFIKDITSSATELNYLDGTIPTDGQVVVGDGTKLTSYATLLFDPITGIVSATGYDGNLETSVTGLKTINSTSILGAGDILLQTPITNAITGTLTAGYIPRALGANTIENSVVRDDGLGIGIGTAADGATYIAKFGSGTVRFSGALSGITSSSSVGYYLANVSTPSTAYSLAFQASNSSGAVVGNTEKPSSIIDFRGQAWNTGTASSKINSQGIRCYSVTGNPTYGRLDFFNTIVDGTTNSQILMSLLTGGNLGIGTIIPGYKLDIVGDININTGSYYKINGVNLTNTDVGAAASSHTHGNITTIGAIGSTANLPLITTTSGIVTVGSFGTTSNTFCVGDDSRLSDSRTPSSHTHGNITNDGKIGSTSGLSVVTTTSGALTVGVTQTPQNLGAALSGSVTMNAANGYNAYGTLTGNITSFSISNAVAGDAGVIELTQGGSGSYTLTTTMTKEGGVLTLSTAVGAVDVIGWYYNGSVFRLNIGKAFA